MMGPDELIRILGLAPHPEGGHFAETYRHTSADGGRGAGTAIYFLLRAGEVSRWHRVDADEIWHYYAGAALELRTQNAEVGIVRRVLGPEIGQGERPQLLVRSGEWQTARSLGEWTLVGATVTPAFDFSGFEMAPEGWEPPDAC